MFAVYLIIYTESVGYPYWWSLKFQFNDLGWIGYRISDTQAKRWRIMFYLGIM